MSESREGIALLPGAEEGRKLLLAARRELHARFGLAAAAEIEAELEWPLPLGGVFATLELEGELRGCIGYMHCDEDIVSLTRRAVVAAALEDPRFGVVLREEVPRLSISVTVLALPVLLSDISEVVIGRDGLLVERGGARGLLLPQVAVKRGWDRDVFVSQTCRKAGLPLDAWRDGVTVVRRFEAVHFGEGA
ncbi:MAG TPA: AmmeMemoRadiSam system protein A [Vicinamibacteria bacterium]|jgi:AmmeMemoRadiSam system protein A